MPRAKNRRKSLFRAALAIAELTAEQWAEKEGITKGHLSLVLNNKRDSGSLIEKIDAFVLEKLPEQAALSA